MMAQADVTLNTQEALDSFRSEHYLYVYTAALELTASPAQAQQLTAQVFQNAARRFANHPVPSNCDMYLAAQVHLAYAQQILPPMAQAPAQDLPPEPPQTAPEQVAKPPQSVAAEPSSDRPLASVANPASQPTYAESSLFTPQATQAVPSAPPTVQAVPAPLMVASAAPSAPQSASAAPATSQTAQTAPSTSPAASQPLAAAQDVSPQPSATLQPTPAVQAASLGGIAATQPPFPAQPMPMYYSAPYAPGYSYYQPVPLYPGIPALQGQPAVAYGVAAPYVQSVYGAPYYAPQPPMLPNPTAPTPYPSEGNAPAAPPHTGEVPAAPQPIATASATHATTASEPVPTATEPERRTPAAGENPTVSDGPACDVLYNPDDTEYWSPDGEPCAPSDPEPQPSVTSWEVDEPEKPSALLSLFNGFLAIAALASVGFLLMQLKVLPQLF